MNIRGKKLFGYIMILIVCTTGCTNEKNLAKSQATKQSNQQAIGEDTVERQGLNQAPIKADEASKNDIDYDLTQMNSEMTYALIYQMMMNPDEYVGKKIKIRGPYYMASNEQGDCYYHYVIIKDAMACCAQGIEFVWEEGQHTNLDEYPKDETEVEVIGTFETYTEEGDEHLYGRLKESSLKVIQ